MRRRNSNTDINICEWEKTGDEAGLIHYNTECGWGIDLYETPKEMEMRYCQFCAGVIQVEN